MLDLIQKGRDISYDRTPMIILNNPTNDNQTGKRIEKELVLKEDYSDELENNFKKRINSENLDFILPDKLEVNETKKHK